MLNIHLVGLKYFSQRDIYFFIPYHLANLCAVLILNELHRMIKEEQDEKELVNESKVKITRGLRRTGEIGLSPNLNYNINKEDEDEANYGELTIKNSLEKGKEPIEQLDKNELEKRPDKDSKKTSKELSYLKYFFNKKKRKSKQVKVIEFSYCKYLTLTCVYFLFKIFWLIIFLTLGMLFLFYQMSIAILLYFVIYIYSFLFMFSKFVSSVGKAQNSNTYIYYGKL